MRGGAGPIVLHMEGQKAKGRDGDAPCVEKLALATRERHPSSGEPGPQARVAQVEGVAAWTTSCSQLWCTDLWSQGGASGCACDAGCVSKISLYTSRCAPCSRAGSATRKMTFFPGHGQHTNKIPTERGEREESIGRMLCYHRHRTTIPHNRYCQDFFSSASESALTPSRLTAGAAASRATPIYCAWRARSQQIATQSSPPSSSWPGGAPSRCSSPSHRGRRPQAT